MTSVAITAPAPAWELLEQPGTSYRAIVDGISIRTLGNRTVSGISQTLSQQTSTQRPSRAVCVKTLMDDFYVDVKSHLINSNTIPTVTMALQVAFNNKRNLNPPTIHDVKDEDRVKQTDKIDFIELAVEAALTISQQRLRIISASAEPKIDLAVIVRVATGGEVRLVVFEHKSSAVGRYLNHLADCFRGGDYSLRYDPPGPGASSAEWGEHHVAKCALYMTRDGTRYGVISTHENWIFLELVPTPNGRPVLLISRPIACDSVSPPLAGTLFAIVVTQLGIATARSPAIPAVSIAAPRFTPVLATGSEQVAGATGLRRSSRIANSQTRGVDRHASDKETRLFRLVDPTSASFSADQVLFLTLDLSLMDKPDPLQDLSDNVYLIWELRRHCTSRSVSTRSARRSEERLDRGRDALKPLLSLSKIIGCGLASNAWTLHCSSAVVKFYSYDIPEERDCDWRLDFKAEVAAYEQHLHNVAGRVVPHFYGAYDVFSVGGVILLENTGVSLSKEVEEFTELPVRDRQDLYCCVFRLSKTGVLHGDLAPRNVTRNHHGQFRIIDFGRYKYTSVAAKQTAWAREVGQNAFDLSLDTMADIERAILAQPYSTGLTDF